MQKILKSCLAATTALLAAAPLGCACWGDHGAREIDSALLAQPVVYEVASLDQHIVSPRQPMMLAAAAAPSALAPSAPAPAHTGPATAPAHDGTAPDIKAKPRETIPQAAAESLARLRAGNERFLTGKHDTGHISVTRRQELTSGQKPFAIVLCCSDSRVPPEIVFDQGLGDIFIIRVAGNVDDSDITASVEYAAEHLHAPLVVVMGHSQCGAVKATIEGGEAPGSLPELVAKIKPAVEKAKAASHGDKTQILGRAIDENVRHSAETLKQSPVVKELEHEGKIYVTGARYDLETGKVEWLK